MSDLIPELSFKDIEKGDSFSINVLNEALSDLGFFSITNHGLSKEKPFAKAITCARGGWRMGLTRPVLR